MLFDNYLFLCNNDCIVNEQTLIREHNMSIAQTILEQIKLGHDEYDNAGVVMMMCWGFNSPRSLGNGLQFSVKGRKLKGTVKVIYDQGLDLYNLLFLNKKNEEVSRIESVYAEDLTNLIDSTVET